MPTTKIHCDYYEIVGPDWSNLEPEKIKAIIQEIESGQMLGQGPDMFGFVRTATWETIIGGYFAVQYMAELRHYDVQKHLSTQRDSPFEELLFVLFAKNGKLVLQNRKFSDLALNMEVATARFKAAVFEMLRRSGINQVISLNHPESEVAAEVFRGYFRESTRIARLKVESPDPNLVPQGFVYYNPQFDRNEIIGNSHRHDYSEFQQVDLAAGPQQNLKETHLAKDLIQAGKPVILKGERQGSEYTLRRRLPSKFEINVNINIDKLDVAALQELIRKLLAEIGLPLETPMLPKPQVAIQAAMFGDEQGTDDEEDNS